MQLALGRGTSMHVEAGLTLDTRDGDTDSVLNSIASAVDAWFTENRQGLRVVADIDRVDQLVSEGILIGHCLAVLGGLHGGNRDVRKPHRVWLM